MIGDRALERQRSAQQRLHVCRIVHGTGRDASRPARLHPARELLYGQPRISLEEHAVRRIKKQQRQHRFALFAQRARHHGRNEDASAQRSEKIGTMWALRAQPSEIFRSHVLDGRMRLAQPIEASGLECPHGLVVAKQLHEMRTDECLAMPTVHNEQRRLAAAAPQGNEHRDRAGACRAFGRGTPNIRSDRGHGCALVKTADVYAKRLPQAHLQLDGQQRIAAEKEKIVVATDGLELQQLLENSSDLAFDIVLRRLDGALRVDSHRRIDLHTRLAIYLAARG